MNQLWLLLAVAVVIPAFVGVAFVIRHWGAGFPARSVRCPHRGTRATISTFSYTKNGWGPVIDRDILRCSLLGDGPVTCDKSCLTQL